MPEVTCFQICGKNLILENVYLINNGYGNLYSGAIVGYSIGSIANCIVSGTVSGSDINNSFPVYVGGIAGSIGGGSISNCINRCEISSANGGSHTYGGGIAGEANNTTISDSQNYGRININGNGSVNGGGIAGSVSGSQVTSCLNSGNIVGVHSAKTSTAYHRIFYLGAIAGSADSITDCKISEGCTIDASYYSNTLGDEIYIGQFVGEGVADPSNSGKAIITEVDLSASTT